MNASANLRLFPQVPSCSFRIASLVLPVSVLVGTDEQLATGGAIVLELFSLCLPEIGALVGTEGLLPDDRLSGVAVRLSVLL